MADQSSELKTVDSVPDLKTYVATKKNVKVVVLLGASVSETSQPAKSPISISGGV